MNEMAADGLILGKVRWMLHTSILFFNKRDLRNMSPGSHGSTFGEITCFAIGKRSTELLYEDNLIENSRIMGDYFKQSLLNLNSKSLKKYEGKVCGV